MQKTKYSMFLLIAILLLSCDNNHSNSDDIQEFEYFPFEIGKKYDLTFFRINDIEEILYEEDMGYLNCSEKLKKDGKIAYRYKQYDIDGDLVSEEFYSYENGKLYIHQDFIKNLMVDILETDIDMPFTFDEPWLCLYDENNDEIIIESHKNNFVIQDIIVVNGLLSYSSKSKIIEEYEVYNTASNCLEMKIKLAFVGKSNFIGDTTKTDMNADFNVKFYLKKNHGKFYTVYLPSQINFLDESFSYGFYSILSN